MRCECHGCLRGSRPSEARHARVTLEAAVDGDDRIEHRDVHDRHRAGRAARSDLLAEHAVFPRSDRRVIVAARVDRNFIPVNDPAAQIATRSRITKDRRRGVRRRRVRDAERVIECRRSLGEGKNGSRLAQTASSGRQENELIAESPLRSHDRSCFGGGLYSRLKSDLKTTTADVARCRHPCGRRTCDNQCSKVRRLPRSVSSSFQYSSHASMMAMARPER